MAEPGGYLPPDWPEVPRETLRFGHGAEAVEVAVPVLPESGIEAFAARLREGARQGVKRMAVDEIVHAVDRTIARLLDRGDPVRRRAEDLLPRVTGYDREMVRIGLTDYLKTFRAHELRRFLAEDFSDPGMLDGFRPRPTGGFARAVGPELMLHIWAGNVPGLPLWSLICGLLVKTASLGKVASAEPLMAGWFAQALAEIEPRLASSLAISWWRGGDEAAERGWAREADIVTAYGGDRALEAIRACVPAGTRFIAHGHRISLGLVAREALNARTVRALAANAARDVAFYDQQGCYSPQSFFIERGGAVSPKDFARHFAAELKALAQKYPRRALSLDEAAAVADWRGREEMAGFSREGLSLMGDERDDFALSFSQTPEPVAPSGLNRTVRVMAIDRLEDIAPHLLPVRRWLQTIGIAASPERLFALSDLLAETGVTRITALGAMSAPEPGWHNDGRFNLADLVCVAEIERQAESAAEIFAPYAD